MSSSQKVRTVILMMHGYEDRRKTTVEACALFNDTHQDRPAMERSTVSKIVGKYRDHGHVIQMVIRWYLRASSIYEADSYGEVLKFRSPSPSGTETGC